MIKTISALAALSLAFVPLHIPDAAAWHLPSKRACFRHAHAPDCGSSAVAICLSRRACALDTGKTIHVCTSWRCQPKDLRRM